LAVRKKRREKREEKTGNSYSYSLLNPIKTAKATGQFGIGTGNQSLISAH
jgi:hypothetical protein